MSLFSDNDNNVTLCLITFECICDYCMLSVFVMSGWTEIAPNSVFYSIEGAYILLQGIKRPR